MDQASLNITLFPIHTFLSCEEEHEIYLIYNLSTAFPLYSNPVTVQAFPSKTDAFSTNV